MRSARNATLYHWIRQFASYAVSSFALPVSVARRKIWRNAHVMLNLRVAGLEYFYSCTRHSWCSFVAVESAWHIPFTWINTERRTCCWGVVNYYIWASFDWMRWGACGWQQVLTRTRSSYIILDTLRESSEPYDTILFYFIYFSLRYHNWISSVGGKFTRFLHIDTTDQRSW